MQPLTPSLQTLVDNDYRFPVGRIKVYATTKSVPSHGFNVAFYGIAPGTDMNVADWWSALSSSPPADPLSEGTFLAGSDAPDLSNIIEPSTALAFDWGLGGVPAPVNDGRVDLWAAIWHGYFFARYPGVYRFYIDSAPHARIRIKFDGAYYGNGTDFIDPDETGDISTDRWDADDANFAKTQHEMYFDTAELEKGQWYAIQIQYFIPRQSDPQNAPAYLCVKYREPDATTDLDLWGNSGGDIVGDYSSDYQDSNGDDIKKPLSAGVVNITNSFLSGIEIPGVSGFVGQKRDSEISEYKFTVALPASTNLDGTTGEGETELSVDSVDGFPEVGALSIGSDPTGIDIVTYTGLDTTNNEFTGCSGVGIYADSLLVSRFMGEGANQYMAGYDPLAGSFGPVKPYRLIQIEGGLYDGASTSYYVDRMWGNIFPNPSIDRIKKEVTFIVRDFGWMTLSKYDKNYPDQASYSMAGYYDPFTYNQPDGISRPPCYDRWRVDKSIKDILIKAGIDPVLLWQRQRYQVSASPGYATDYGPYLLKGDLVLDSLPEYGNSYGIERTGADDKYIWAFGYGAYLWENLSEIIKNYAYKFGFTASGFAKAQSFGSPDHEFYPDDTLDDLVFTSGGGDWNNDSDNISDLNTFRGRYRASNLPGAKASLKSPYPYWSDAEIVLQLHDDVDQKIKIKVDATYVTQLIINGALTNGTGGGGDEFAITSQPSGLTRSYYDGLDSSTGVNPCVIQLAAPGDLKQQLLEVEVVTGEIRLNAIFLYGSSTRSTVRTLNDEQMSALSMEKDITNQRNEITVIGAARGLAKDIDGQVINPNNPIYIHTVSRAIDLRSLYENDYINYTGHTLSSEIYDERLLDQERADYVAVTTLLKYRGQEITGSASFLFDPRLEIMDALSISEKHSKMYDASQCWILGISEEYRIGNDGDVSYITKIDRFSPRPPSPSMRLKPEPALSDWNNEPIVNIGLFYRGFRVSGNDATYVTRTITIATSPGWDTDIWAGYWIFDKDGNGHEIAINNANSVTLAAWPITDWVDGNWSIGFDPLDADNGEAIEIRYDQIITGTINIQIISARGELVANLNENTAERIALWGSDKKIFWNGEVQYGYKESRRNYLISPYTLADFRQKMPLAIRFSIIHDTTGNKDVILTHAVDSDDTPYAAPRMNGDTATTQNSYGAAKIIPRLLDTGYYIGWKAYGNYSGADNTILDAGRVYKITDQTGGVYRLFIEGRGVYNPISDAYNGKYVISGLSGAAKIILASGNDGTDGWVDISFSGTQADAFRQGQGWSGHWNIFRQGTHTEATDDAEWFWVRIVENQYQPIMFNETDNNNRGLLLKFSSPSFWVEGLSTAMFKNGLNLLSTSAAITAGVATVAIGALYKIICENKLTIHHAGSSHIITSQSEVKLAQFGTVSKPITLEENDYRYPISWLDTNEKTQHGSFFVFWSKYYPTKLWFTAGMNPDCLNPEEGTFLIASISNFTLIGGPAMKTTIRCATSQPKASSFVMAPFLEIHQIAGPLSDLGGWYDIRSALWRGPNTLQEESAFEHKLQEFNSFVSARDLIITINPHRLQGTEIEGESLYFWKRLRDEREPGYALWHFLIKPVILDRVGRSPKNWLDYDIYDLLDEEDIMDSEFTFGDWTGITAFWHPGAGYTAVAIGDGSNWNALKYLADALNIARAVPLNIWTKD